jgi:hypothetical protein
MKKNVLVFCFLIFTSSVFGQQFLWSTVNDTAFRHVPLDSVSNDVLVFYDHYQFYHDGAGFTKAGFVKFFEGSQSYKTLNNSQWKALKKTIYEISDISVFAFRVNSGQGSVILVMCVSKDNVNFISFSNNYENDSVVTYSTKRENFASWFKTLLN